MEKVTIEKIGFKMKAKQDGTTFPSWWMLTKEYDGVFFTPKDPNLEKIKERAWGGETVVLEGEIKEVKGFKQFHTKDWTEHMKEVNAKHGFGGGKDPRVDDLQHQIDQINDTLTDLWEEIRKIDKKLDIIEGANEPNGDELEF